MTDWEWPQYLTLGGLLGLWGYLAGTAAARKIRKEFCPPVAAYVVGAIVGEFVRLLPILVGLHFGGFWK